MPEAKPEVGIRKLDDKDRKEMLDITQVDRVQKELNNTIKIKEAQMRDKLSPYCAKCTRLSFEDTLKRANLYIQQNEDIPKDLDLRIETASFAKREHFTLIKIEQVHDRTPNRNLMGYSVEYECIRRHGIALFIEKERAEENADLKEWLAKKKPKSTKEAENKK